MRILVLAATAMLAACGAGAPSGGAAAPQAAAQAATAFPDLASASYRAEVTATGPNGEALPIVMARSGGKLRFEVNSARGAAIIVRNGDDSFVVTNRGGQRVALRTSNFTQFEDPAENWGTDLAAEATHVGGCSVAGESGQEWRRMESGVAKTACVTNDGIILRVTDGDRIAWDTTKVERGPQDPSLFEVPADAQVLDLNNLQGMAQALERARAGAGN